VKPFKCEVLVMYVLLLVKSAALTAILAPQQGNYRQFTFQYSLINHARGIFKVHTITTSGYLLFLEVYNIKYRLSWIGVMLNAPHQMYLFQL